LKPEKETKREIKQGVVVDITGADFADADTTAGDIAALHEAGAGIPHGRVDIALVAVLLSGHSGIAHN